MARTAIFVLEKETKNTLRYTEKPESGQAPFVGTQYVQKWAFPTSPKQIKVTIEEG